MDRRSRRRERALKIYVDTSPKKRDDWITFETTNWHKLNDFDLPLKNSTENEDSIQTPNFPLRILSFYFPINFCFCINVMHLHNIEAEMDLKTTKIQLMRLSWKIKKNIMFKQKQL